MFMNQRNAKYEQQKIYILELERYEELFNLINQEQESHDSGFNINSDSDSDSDSDSNQESISSSSRSLSGENQNNRPYLFQIIIRNSLRNLLR